jgi:hypothetical protein
MRLKSKRSVNKKVRNATAKVYKGIKFRSKLELFAYVKLEEAGIAALYEKKKYVLMEGFRFESKSIESNSKKEYVENITKVRDITYTPDFVDPNNEWVIEVKGFANDVFPVKWKLFKKHLQELGEDTPMLFLPRNQKQVLETIEILKKKFYDET